MIKPGQFLHVFHWPTNYPIRLVLPAMILVSVLLHVAGVYLVRSEAAPRSASGIPVPGKLTLLPSSAGSVLLAAKDPSWLEPGRFRDRMLGVPRPQRTRRALKPELPSLVEAPEPSLPAAWIPALPPLSVRPWFEEKSAAVAPPTLQGLSARFDPAGPSVTEELLGRLRTGVPAEIPGLPTELLVVLDAAGEARHVWLLRSCGVPSLDMSAQQAVRRSRLGPSADGYRGILRVVWGPGETRQ